MCVRYQGLFPFLFLGLFLVTAGCNDGGGDGDVSPSPSQAPDTPPQEDDDTSLTGTPEPTGVEPTPEWATATPLPPTPTEVPATPTVVPATPTPADEDGDGYPVSGGDCDDLDATVYPGATEVPYDGVDQDCDGADLTDQDGDGFDGEPVVGGTDCDDEDANTYPGAVEFADGRDNDCDGAVDEGLDITDDDGDGASEEEGDCNDEDPEVYPGADEVPYDGVDQDCDGADLTDQDGDGFDAVEVAGGTDCDDADPGVSPAAAESCNGVDDDCNGVIDDGVTSVFHRDADGDGYGDPAVATAACSAPAGYVVDATDCVDTDDDIHPGAVELCNGVDDDCDGEADEGLVIPSYYLDQDGDGFGDPASSMNACSAPEGHVSNALDCNDTDAQVYPGAQESCNGVDDDCDGVVDDGLLQTFFLDADNDGYGTPGSTTLACEAPAGHVTDATDCRDDDPTIHPGADEVCNGLDDDCDTEADEGVLETFFLDLDGDGFGNPDYSLEACSPPGGYGTTAGDCDDLDPTVHPDADEVPNGADDDCDGEVDEGVSFSSCKAILETNPSSSSGLYTIDPDGAGTGVDPFEVYCDMVTAGGGWTFLATVTNNGDAPDTGNWLVTEPSPNRWENEDVFGLIDPSLNQDFRSAAFHTLPGDELMITHRNLFLLRTDENCLEGDTLRDRFAALDWTCGGSASFEDAPECAHPCNIVESTPRDNDGALLAGAARSYLFFKAGEADGAQDANKDRAYLSTDYRNNVDFPTGLGAFCSGTYCNPRTGEADVNNRSDAITPAPGTEFYGLWIR